MFVVFNGPEIVFHRVRSNSSVKATVMEDATTNVTPYRILTTKPYSTEGLHLMSSDVRT